MSCTITSYPHNYIDKNSSMWLNNCIINIVLAKAQRKIQTLLVLISDCKVRANLDCANEKLMFLGIGITHL